MFNSDDDDAVPAVTVSNTTGDGGQADTKKVSGLLSLTHGAP